LDKRNGRNSADADDREARRGNMDSAVVPLVDKTDPTVASDNESVRNVCDINEKNIRVFNDLFN
jgi:hypothetical protein